MQNFIYTVLLTVHAVTVVLLAGLLVEIIRDKVHQRFSDEG